MRPRSLLWLSIVAVLLTVHALVFESNDLAGDQRSRAFPGLDPADILKLRIERPGAARDAALGVEARPVTLERLGSPPTWWITEPIRYEAFHPRAQGLAYDVAELVQLAEVKPGEGPDPFSSGPELVLTVSTREGKEDRIEIGPEHPDPKLSLAYLRRGGRVFLVRREIRKSLTFSLNDLRTRATFGIAPPDVAACDIVPREGPARRIERVGKTDFWRLKAPLDAVADRELVEGLLRELNSWLVTGFENDHAASADFERAGLGAPRARITLTRNDGEKLAFDIGADVPPPAGAPGQAPEVYLRPVERPFLLRGLRAPYDLAVRSPEEYRARYLLDLGLEEVDEIAVASQSGESFALRRTKKPEDRETSWSVHDAGGKLLYAGDRSEIEVEVANLRRLLIHKFNSEGLATPRRQLTIRTSAGRKLEVLVGEPSALPEDRGQNFHTVAIPGEAGSLKVSSLFLSRLERGPIAFRKKDLSNLEMADLRELRVVDGDREWTLARVDAGDPWMLALDKDHPVTPGSELSSARVEQLVRELHHQGFRVVGFETGPVDLAASGLELNSPRRAVILERVESTEPLAFRTLVVGKTAGDPPVTLGRVDSVDTPPLLLEDDFVRTLEALVSHLRQISPR